MHYLWVGLAGLTLFSACNGSSSTKETSQEASAPQDSAQWIMDQAIARHGGSLFNQMDLSFDFRKRHYTVRHEDGRYEYTRAWTTDSTGSIRDVLNNDGFIRYHDGEAISISSKDSAAFANSVNSVAYFTLLPHGLNDGAVIKNYVGKVSIKSEPYYKVKVTFQQDGGGTDFDDVFYYWIHEQKLTMDYFAYYYHTNGGGSRFREAIDPVTKEGLLLQDYINYTYTGDSVPVADYDLAFNEGRVKELSRIINENERVNILTKE